jgi:mannose-1-phosphate guanylyltransferase
MESSTWAIVLAAGDGTRLRSLTVDPRGKVVPKQFCSLRGGPTLLMEALRRARRVAPPERTLVVVAEQQREYWRESLAHLPRENVLAQPANHGTTAGLLLPLLSVLARDAGAVVAVLPSDHYVQHESILSLALASALRAAHDPSEERGIVLLGIRPDGPDSGYGWIVSEPSSRRLRGIRGFVEKPPPAVAERLYRSGGLWSSFLMAARASSFVALIERRVPDLFGAFRAHSRRDGAWTPDALSRLYSQIGSSDLSRDVLQGAESDLLVFEAPACGWTDLGTPERVRACLAALSPARNDEPTAAPLSLREALVSASAGG